VGPTAARPGAVEETKAIFKGSSHVSAGWTMFHRTLLTSNEIQRAGGGPGENVKTFPAPTFCGLSHFAASRPGVKLP
jgi:hypothetical protein